MTGWRAILAMMCVAGVTNVAGAQAAPEQKAEHIVTLSFNAAVLQTAEAQKSLNALQTKFAPKQKQLQTLNDEVEGLRKQLADTNTNLTDAERTLRARSLETKEKDLQRQAEDFKSDSQSESEQVFQRVAQKVYAFLQTYSQQHGYSAVIERGSDANPVVWYAANNLDITDDLIKAYNAQGEGASSTPATAPSRSGPTKPGALPESPAPH
jgi:outer membrane protein